MKVILTDKLQEGMLLGQDIYVNNRVVLKQGTFLELPNILFLQNHTNQVAIYSLEDIDRQFKKDATSRKFYALSLMNHIKCTFECALTSEADYVQAYNFLVKLLTDNPDVISDAYYISYYHGYTLQHSIKVSIYAYLIGRQLGLSLDNLVSLLIGGIYHDVGKVNIDKAILDKPAKLTEAEFAEIKKHPLYSASALKTANYIPSVIVNIASQHHEKLDGSGYPFGLQQNQIQPLTKIITVADIFDACTSARVYHSARTSKEGFNILFDCVKRQEVDNLLVQSLRQVLLK